MTRTEDLIATLATDARPVRRPASRLALAVAAGVLFAFFGLMVVLGSPFGPVEARGVMASGMKVAYPLAVAIIAVATALAVGRPAASFGIRAAILGVPLLYVAVLAATDLAVAPPADWGKMAMGTTYAFCLGAVTLGSLPAFVALVWAFRALAPTRLTTAGFLIGLGAGGASATAYALYCPETSPAFLLAAYTPAMLIPALGGAIAGQRLLRW